MRHRLWGMGIGSSLPKATAGEGDFSSRGWGKGCDSAPFPLISPSSLSRQKLIPSVWGTSLGTGFWRWRRGVGAGRRAFGSQGCRWRSLRSPSLPGRAPREVGGRKTWDRECLGVVRSNRMGQRRSGTGATGLQREQTLVEGWGQERPRRDHLWPANWVPRKSKGPSGESKSKPNPGENT